MHYAPLSPPHDKVIKSMNIRFESAILAVTLTNQMLQTVHNKYEGQGR